MSNYRNKATAEWETESRVRNPDLQGQRFDIFQFISDNRGCTRADITKALGLRGTSATARVKELIDLGLVYASAADTKYNSLTNKRVQTLWPVKSAVHRIPKDRVRVTITLQVDEAGRYHVKSRLFGELPVKGRLVDVMTKEVTILAPYVSEYKHNFTQGGSDGLSEVPVEDTLSNANLIIDNS